MSFELSAEDRLMMALMNEESGMIKVEGFDVHLNFKRPPLALKHKVRSWSFKKQKELQLDEEDKEGQVILQLWAQLNGFVFGAQISGKDVEITREDNGKFVFDKVYEDIYNRNLDDYEFLYNSYDALSTWLAEISLQDKEEDIKNS